MNFNLNTGDEMLVDESNRRATPDNVSESFYYAYGAADSERMTTSQGLAGGMSPGSTLYSRFIRNASLGGVPSLVVEALVDESGGRQTPDNLSESFYYAYGAADSERMTTSQGLSGLGLTAEQILAAPEAYGFMRVDNDDGSVSYFNPTNGDSITTDGYLVDPAGMVMTGSGGVLQTGAVNPGGVNTVGGSDYLTRLINVAPQLLQGLTTLQLSQINLQRMQNGLPPLTTGQVLGVAGAPPAITQNMVLGIGAVIAAVVLLGKKG